MKINSFVSVLLSILGKIIYLLVVLALISFVASNTDSVELGLFPFNPTINMPMFLLLIFTFFMGFAIAIFCFFVMGLIDNRSDSENKE